MDERSVDEDASVCEHGEDGADCLNAAEMRQVWLRENCRIRGRPPKWPHCLVEMHARHTSPPAEQIDSRVDSNDEVMEESKGLKRMSKTELAQLKLCWE